MSEFRQRLLGRARRLQDLATERSEAQLLCAAVWLEVRARSHACSGIAERIALHYLLLAEHTEVLGQPGLSARYAQRAWLWADQAEHGAPRLADLRSRARVDA